MHPSTASIISSALFLTTSFLLTTFLLYTLIFSKQQSTIRLPATTRSPWTSPQSATFPRFPDNGQPSERKASTDIEGQHRDCSDEDIDIGRADEISGGIHRRRVAAIAFTLTVTSVAVLCAALGVVRVLQRKRVHISSTTGPAGQEGLERAERVLFAFLRVSLSLTLVYALFASARGKYRTPKQLHSRFFNLGRQRPVPQWGYLVGCAFVVTAFALDIAYTVTATTFLPIIARLFTLLLAMTFAGITVATSTQGRFVSRPRRASYAQAQPNAQEKVTANGPSFIQWMSDSPASDTFLVPPKPSPPNRAVNRDLDEDSTLTTRQPLFVLFAVAVCALSSVCLELVSAVKQLQGDTNLQPIMTVVQTVCLVLWTASSASLLTPSSITHCLQHNVPLTRPNQDRQHTFPLPFRRDRAPSSASIASPPSPVSLSFPRSSVTKSSPSITKPKRKHRPRGGSSSKLAPTTFEAPTQDYMEPSDITDLTDPFAVSSLSLACTGNTSHSACFDQLQNVQITDAPHHYPTGTLSPSTTLAAGSPFPVVQGQDTPIGSMRTVLPLDFGVRLQEGNERAGFNASQVLHTDPRPTQQQARERVSAQWGNIPTDPPPPEVRTRLNSMLLGDESSLPMGLGVSIRGSSESKHASIPLVSSSIISGETPVQPRSPSRRGSRSPSDVFSPRKIKLESPPRTNRPSGLPSSSRRHVKLKKSLTLPSPLRAFGVLSSSGFGHQHHHRGKDHVRPGPFSSQRHDAACEQPISHGLGVYGMQTTQRASLSDLDGVAGAPCHLPRSVQEDAILAQELLEALSLEGSPGRR